MLAANVMNASVNKTHSPSHRIARSQPAKWGWHWTPRNNLTIILGPKGYQLLETEISLRIAAGRKAPPLTYAKGKIKNQKPSLGVAAGEMNLLALQWGALAFPASLPDLPTRSSGIVREGALKRAMVKRGPARGSCWSLVGSSEQRIPLWSESKV